MAITSNAPVPVMELREWAMLLALAVLWGGSFFFNGVAVRELPSFTLVWLRVVVAAGALLAVMRVSRQRMPHGRGIWAAFFGMGLLNNVLPFALIAWGQHRIASGLTSILIATMPLFTVLVAHALTPDEKLSPSKGAGVAMGFAGAAVMIGPDALGGLGTALAAQFACLGAALSYAFGSIFGRRFRHMGVTPVATAAGQVSASAVMLLPIMLALDHPWSLPMLHAATWGAVLSVGLLSTALAYVLYFRILATAGATNISLVTFLSPPVSILLGVAVLNETLTFRHFAGMALIGVGLAFLDGRLPRLLLRSSGLQTSD